jgi:hypothetical protein
MPRVKVRGALARVLNGSRISEGAPQSFESVGDNSEVEYASFQTRIALDVVIETRIGHRRQHARDAGNERSEDSVCALRNGTLISAVIADGVSGSFMGYVCSSEICRSLARYLLECAIPPTREDVAQFLDGLRDRMNFQLSAVTLPRRTPDRIKEVVEGRRARGSQACFGAVRFDPLSGLADLYMVGNIAAVFWLGSAQYAVFVGPSREKWSSSPSNSSPITHRQVSNVRTVALVSDGFHSGAGLDGHALLRELLDLETFSNLAQRRALDDDVSFVLAAIVKQSNSWR